MPTGYTAALVDDKKPVGTKQFAIQCLRAMGVAILMRDDLGDVQVPKRLDPDTNYNDRALVEANKELDRWLKTPLADRVIQTQARKDLSIQAVEQQISRNAEENRRFHIALQDILGWNVDPELTGYKDFMLEQLRMSVNGGTWAEDEIERINTKDIGTHLAEYEANLRRNVQYHANAILEEIERTEKRNAWLSMAWEAIEKLPETSDWEVQDAIQD